MRYQLSASMHAGASQAPKPPTSLSRCLSATLLALAVGSVCAAHMVQGYRGVDRRKADARNRRDRRGRWVSRSWEPREDGSEALSAYGYLTTVGLSEGGWQVRVTVEDAESMWHDGGFETKDDARLAGFDHIEEVGRLLPR